MRSLCIFKGDMGVSFQFRHPEDVQAFNHFKADNVLWIDTWDTRRCGDEISGMRYNMQKAGAVQLPLDRW